MSDTPSAAKKRILAIGDIHGCLTALQTLAERVPFRPESDILVTLGDHVDRGPDSKGVIDWLLAWEGERVSLRGNHEIMMFEARAGVGWARGWDQVGGRETLDSYGPDSKVGDIPAEHWDFLESLVPFHETETHFFVHEMSSRIGNSQINLRRPCIGRNIITLRSIRAARSWFAATLRKKTGYPNSMGTPPASTPGFMAKVGSPVWTSSAISTGRLTNEVNFKTAFWSRICRLRLVF